MDVGGTFCHITFEVKAELNHGEEIYACGDSVSLGCFDPERGVQLVTTPEKYPVWYNLDPVRLHVGQDARFKFAVFSGGSFERWETLSSDRVLRVSKAGIVKVGATLDNSKKMKVEVSDSDAAVPSGEQRNSESSTRSGDGSFRMTANRSPAQMMFSKRRLEDNVELEGSDGVIVVTYRLPVLVSRLPDGTWTVEWDNEHLLAHRDDRLHLLYVGRPRSTHPIPPEDEEHVANLLRAYRCHPVFLDPDLATKFYDGFCMGTLWPVFHNIVDIFGQLPTRHWDSSTQMELWHAYTTVNRIFALKVVEVFNEKYLVWVHDFHFLVLPSFLSRRLQGGKIGLFVHTPFPSSEIFRTLSVREDLLRGMLCADQLGFHLFEYTRHFSACCRRLLDINSELVSHGRLEMEYNGRAVVISSMHVGVSVPIVRSVLETERAQSLVEEVKRRHEGKVVIVGVDAIHRLNGVPLKLRGIETLLSAHPEWKSRLVLVQVCVIPEAASTRESERYRETVADMVTQINTTYGTPGDPVVYLTEVESMPLPARLALFSVADIMLVTSIREGLNSFPMEYVATQSEENPGVVVITEFTGGARVLQGALGMTPWKQEEIADALLTSLEMGVEERVERHKRSMVWLQHNSVLAWAREVLSDLKGVSKLCEEEGVQLQSVGLGMGFRMLGMTQDFEALSMETVLRDYRQAMRRLIFLDYGGTLMNDTGVSRKGTLKFAPRDLPDSTLGMLHHLCQDPRNTVFIVSGVERDELLQKFGSVPWLGLAAEHGFFYRFGSVTPANASPEWEMVGDHFDESWMEVTNSIMSIYTQRTNGTYVEIKGSALLWQYRDADFEFGQLQAKELEDHLIGVLKNFPVEVLRGKGYLEVRPEGVDKGRTVELLMSKMTEGGRQPVDFVLALGDDNSDEFMFQSLESMREDMSVRNSRMKLFTATVGKKPSNAANYLNDVDEVLELLTAMTRLSTKSNRNLSMTDLSKMADVGGFGSPGRSHLSPDVSGAPHLAANVGGVTFPSLGPQGQGHSGSYGALDALVANTSRSAEQFFESLEEGEDEDGGGVFF